MSDNPYNPDLKIAYKELKAKQFPITVLWNYYDGDHPIVFTSSAIMDIFKGKLTRFAENWAAVVVDSPVDRLSLKGLTSEDASANTTLEDVFSDEQLLLDADDVHLSVGVCGEGFLIGEEIEEGEPSLFVNDARLCYVKYSPADPRKKQFAAKWWVGDDERRYITLYYEDHLEYYVSRGRANTVSSHMAFVPLSVGNVGEGEDIADNPYEMIPVFHFRRNQRRVVGEITPSVIDLQNCCNKMLSDLMVTSDFHAFPQRYAVTSADLSKLLASQTATWKIPPANKEEGEEETQIGQFEQADLSGYLEALDSLANKIMIQTRTPKHYFMQVGEISGEALIAMEAPLIKKVGKYQLALTPTWKEVGAWICGVSGTPADPKSIKPVWEDAKTVQPGSDADALLKEVQAGIPLEVALKRRGWTEEDLALVAAGLEANAQREAAIAEAAMAAASRKLEQGEGAV